MRPFNPLQERKYLDETVGIQRYRMKNRDEEEAYHAVGRTASSMLTKGIECLLVGYRNAAKELLSKAKEWLEYAIETNEHPKGYERHSTEARRHLELALCNWLLYGVHDVENLTTTIEHNESYNTHHPDFDKTETSYLLSEYIDARAYKKALALFEATPGTIKPPSAGQAKTEGQMSYAIAAMRERGEFTIEEVSDALEKFFRRTIGVMLREGQSPAVARWMKIAYFNETSNPLEPEAALLKCYDFLPGVEFPGFEEK